MIGRVLAAVLAVPFALLWLGLAFVFSGSFDDAGAELLFEEGDYSTCGADAAAWVQAVLAVAGAAAIAAAVFGRRRRGRFAIVAVVLFAAWVGVWAAGGCGVGGDDELEAAVIPRAASLELRASPFHPSTPRIPRSPMATG